MQRIRIERKAPFRGARDRLVVLPLDPRDPDILRAKRLLDRGANPGSLVARIRTA
jgi:hypothetical protein